jgi:predicted RNA-binding Zn-ribbon protein involved in translation (DUF1610 family)
MAEEVKCPKCGSEMEVRFGVPKNESLRTDWHHFYHCPACGYDESFIVQLTRCGHEEKVPLVDPWNPYMADDDGEKR